MSGIVGIISKEIQDERKNITEMLKIIKHRGDSYKNIVIDKNVTIGFQSDLNKIAQNGNIYLFMDGLIYNRSHIVYLISEKNTALLNDEDVLLNLYIKYGVESFKLVNGDFAVVIWDSLKEALFLIKYISNHKNIYYYKDADSFIFASEIKSLMKHPEVKRRIDFQSVNNFLTFRHIPFPYTVFEDIRRLEPASVIIYKQNQIEKRSLSFFKINQKIKTSEEIVILKKLIDLFEKSILRRINKAKHYGLFLSGGIDSSTILYFLHKFSDKPVRTYTVGLKRDEIYAQKIAKYFKCKHTNFKLSPNSLINILPKTLWHLEYPIAHAGSFQYYLSKISNKEKYIFWGQGAEELFYGRQDYLILAVVEQIKKVFPDFIWKGISRILPEIWCRGKLHKLTALLIAEDPFEIYKAFREILTFKEKKEILNENIILKNLKYAQNVFKQLILDSLANYSSYTLCNGFLSDTFFNLRQEILNPYLDKDFISLTYSIPSHMKIRQRKIRYLQKKIMENRLPNFILKRGRDTWHLQTRNWVNIERKKYYYFIERLKNRQIIKPGFDKFLDKHSFRRDEKLWSLLSLEIIFEIFIDNHALTEPPVLKIW